MNLSAKVYCHQEEQILYKLPTESLIEINQEARPASLKFTRRVDLIYDIKVQTVYNNLNQITNQNTKVSIILGQDEVYRKKLTDNCDIDAFNITNPIPVMFPVSWINIRD